MPTASPIDGQQFLDTVGTFARVLAIKVYRLRIDTPPAVPVLPCLDHEAMLHSGIPPHAAAYIKDATGNLHEIVFVPERRRLDVDVVSTIGQYTRHTRTTSSSRRSRKASRALPSRSPALRSARRPACRRSLSRASDAA